MGTRNLPSRSTRGKRMNTLVGDEALVDEEFWKLDLFKDEEGDDEYKSEEEEEDVVDADFDNPEEREEEGEANVDKERPEKKRKQVYVDPKTKKPKRTKLSQDAKLKSSQPDQANDAEDDDVEILGPTPSSPSSSQPTPPSTPATIRKSTRAVALQRYAEREKEREESEKKRSSRPKKRTLTVVRRITQEELLEEAKITEQINTESLKYILSLEEEKKKVKEAPTIVGPVVTYYSKDGMTCVCFDELPPILQNGALSPPTSLPREKCPVTGLPAKYKDPKTGISYANAEAFKQLRVEHLQQEEDKFNSRLVQLQSMLQDSKRKKEVLQKMPLPSQSGFVAVL